MPSTICLLLFKLREAGQKSPCQKQVVPKISRSYNNTRRNLTAACTISKLLLERENGKWDSPFQQSGAFIATTDFVCSRCPVCCTYPLCNLRYWSTFNTKYYIYIVVYGIHVTSRFPGVYIMILVGVNDDDTRSRKVYKYKRGY